MGMCQAHKQKYYPNFSKKVLGCIVNAPWYARISDIHTDLKIDTVEEEIKKHARRHQQGLEGHPNAKILRMFDEPTPYRRLKRTKPADLIN